MEELTLLETIEWSQDPLNLCVGQPVIPASDFVILADSLAEFPEVTKTGIEIHEVLMEQSKRFAACGANHSDRLGVIRKNPKTGWQYIIDLITEK